MTARFQRLSLALSSLALLVAITGVGPAGARALKRVVFAANAGRVNGIEASHVPRAGQLLALGDNSRFPASVVPAGPRGPRGVQGPAGPAGATGTAGTAYVFRAHAVAAQDTPNPGSMKVLLGGEDFDPHGDFDATASTYVAPVDGYYEFFGAVVLSGSAAGRVIVQITTSRPGMNLRGSDDTANAFHTGTAGGLMHLKRGDVIELTLYTSQQTTITFDEALTQLSGALVAEDR